MNLNTLNSRSYGNFLLRGRKWYELQLNHMNSSLKYGTAAWTSLLGRQWTRTTSLEVSRPVFHSLNQEGIRERLRIFQRQFATIPGTRTNYVSRGRIVTCHVKSCDSSNPDRELCYMPCTLWKRFMAGHSKWQNIRHIKAAKDREKAITFQKFTNKIRRVVREGGPNPNLNSKLAGIIKEARACNVPNSTIEAAIKRSADAKLQSGLVALKGPNTLFFIVEVETDNMNRTIHNFKHLLKKNNCMAIVDESRIRHIFEQKGVVRAAVLNSGEKLTKEKAEELAIEAEAEEVIENSQADGNTMFDFISSIENFGKVRKTLESHDVKVEEYSLEYVATQFADVEEDALRRIGELYDSIQELTEVVKIYDNIRA